MRRERSLSPKRQRGRTDSYNGQVSENRFLADQKKRGAIIRLKDQRATVIDHFAVLAKGLESGSKKYEEESFNEVKNRFPPPPLKAVLQLSLDDLSDLEKQVQEFCKIDSRNLGFWKACSEFVGYVIERQGKKSVDEDVYKIIDGKSATELTNLESKVLKKMSDNPINQNFWLTLLREIKLSKASQTLYEYHRIVMSRHGGFEAEEEVKEKEGEKTEEDEVKQQMRKEERMPNALHSIKDFPTNPNLKIPEYSTKVVLGYDWNRYNKAHYNSENPPPKVPQGYKFDIYYPELKQKDVPSYKILHDNKAKSADECTIVFQAPNAYQDIAFRIANRQWDRSHISFVSKFENGILQVHFQFRKVFYNV